MLPQAGRFGCALIHRFEAGGDLVEGCVLPVGAQQSLGQHPVVVGVSRGLFRGHLASVDLHAETRGGLYDRLAVRARYVGDHAVQIE